MTKLETIVAYWGICVCTIKETYKIVITYYTRQGLVNKNPRALDVCVLEVTIFSYCQIKTILVTINLHFVLVINAYEINDIFIET